MPADPVEKLIARFAPADQEGVRRLIAEARSLGWRRFRPSTDAVQDLHETPSTANVWAEDGAGKLHMLNEIEPPAAEAAD